MRKTQVPALLGQPCALGPFDELRKIPDSLNLTGCDIANAVRLMKSWLYLRFTDGAFFSMCGGTRRGGNPDGSRYHPDTCGRELRATFNEAYDGVNRGVPITIELAPCWTQWSAVQEAVGKMSLQQRAATVVGPVLTQATIDGSIFQILEALRDSPSHKAWVAQAADRPVVAAVRMAMLEAPRPDAWNHIEKLEATVVKWVDTSAPLLVTTIGLPSRCLQWRTWAGTGVSIDLGSVPDALMGRKTRSYLKRDGRHRAVRQAFLEWQAEKR